MATIKEIAERAGVSIGTVDRVIHNRGRVAPETRELILQLVQDLNYKPNSVAKGLAIMRKKRKFTFFIVHPADHPFFGQVLEGAQKKAEELMAYGVEVEFREITSLEMPLFDPEGFSSDGIAMIYFSNKNPISQWAKERNVPIVYYNSSPPDDDYSIAYVGCDYFRAGTIAAGLAAIICGGTGNVGILSEGNDSVLSYGDREQGFRRELQERYPQMRIAPSYTTGYEEDLSDVALRMLAEHPDLDLIYLVNPGDYSVCKTIQAAAGSKPIQIVTNDLTPSQRDYLKDGIITATICQEPEKQGAQALELLFQYVVNGSVPETRDCLTNLTIHISQNI